MSGSIAPALASFEVVDAGFEPDDRAYIDVSATANVGGSISITFIGGSFPNRQILGFFGDAIENPVRIYVDQSYEATFQVFRVVVSNNDINDFQQRTYFNADLVAGGFQTSWVFSDLESDPDTTPPVIAEIIASEPGVEEETGRAFVDITLTVDDPESGHAITTVSFVNEAGDFIGSTFYDETLAATQRMYLDEGEDWTQFRLSRIYTENYRGVGAVYETPETLASLGITTEWDFTVSGPTNGPDSLTGTETANTISGLAGADTIEGLGGNDTLNGNQGRDRLLGNEGDDLIRGGAGNDTILGGLGDDTLAGGADNDRINGGLGDDRLSGQAGNDTLRGFDGEDTVLGGLGHDVLAGGNDNDSLGGDGGRDTLDGGQGEDTLNGGDGNDRLIGGADSDTLVGGRNNDTLLGGADADRLSGGNGKDVLNGGNGRDFLNGQAGHDTLLGGYGRDTLIGGAGDDRLEGGEGIDTLTGGDGADVFVYSDLGGNIQDFNLAEDLIELDAALFTALSIGTLAAEAFTTTGFTSTDHRIWYDPVSGDLRYDADGSAGPGALDHVLFGDMNTGLALTADHFVVV